MDTREILDEMDAEITRAWAQFALTQIDEKNARNEAITSA